MNAEPAVDRERPSEIVAGFLATASIFLSLTGLAYRPLRLVPLALLLAFVAAAMARSRHARLAAAAAGIGTACFVAGLAIAVLTENPLF
jgi:membrane-bound ClpP family serine protease